MARGGIQEIGEPTFAVVETARAHRMYSRRMWREIRRSAGRTVSAVAIGAAIGVVLVSIGAPGGVVWSLGLATFVATAFLFLGPIVFCDSPLSLTYAWSESTNDLVSALRAGLPDTWTVLWDRHVDGGATVTVCVGPAGVWMLWTVQPGFDCGTLATAARSLTPVVPGVAVRWEWRQPWSSAPWREVVSRMEMAPPVLSAGGCRRVVRQLMIPVATERLWSLRSGLRS